MQAKTKCLSKIKGCKSVFVAIAKNKNYVCSGELKKPSKYKGDTVAMCIKGKFVNLKIELTPNEAIIIMAALDGAS